MARSTTAHRKSRPGSADRSTEGVVLDHIARRRRSSPSAIHPPTQSCHHQAHDIITGADWHGAPQHTTSANMQRQ
eukprot:6452309-Karenia_brevis.AAC.1